VQKDSKAYYKACDTCQRTRNPSRSDELPLKPQISLQVFDKWVIDFVGTIQPPGKNTDTQYIITVTRSTSGQIL